MYPDEWTEHNRAWGQSDLTACLIHLTCGGRIKYGLAPGGIRHFWNFLEDRPRYDLCRTAFKETPKFKYSGFIQLKPVLCDVETKKRWINFKQGIVDAGFPLSVDDQRFVR